MSLAVSGLTLAYGERVVLEGLSLDLRPGEVLGILGPNGSGKTSLVKVLSRTLKPKRGALSLNGLPDKAYSSKAWARSVAVVAQAAPLPEDYDVRTVVAMGRYPYQGFFGSETAEDVRVVEDVMRRTATWGFRDSAVGDLSGGEKQRVMLARALAQEPNYLLLDEPTNHLDLKFQVEMMRAVRAEVRGGVAALVVLHDLNLALRICDRLVVLCEGRVVSEGSPVEVLDSSLLQRVYGAEVSLVTGADRLPIVLPQA